MLFQMQIPEMFSYVGMKDTKNRMKCFLFLPKKYKMEERVKIEHNLATQAVYEHFYIYIFICFFSILHLLVLLLSILKYV